VGFTDHPEADRIRLAKASLHQALTESANTTGIDYSQNAIRYFRENGVFDNVVFGNVEKLDEVDVTGPFDVIVAGDIIEHLSNPCLMLDGLKRFFHKDTVLVITTPHAFGLLNFIRFARGRFAEGKEHVMTFNAINIRQLLERHGYVLESLDTCYQKHATGSLFFAAGKAFFERFPKFGGTLFARARLQDAA
jgi:hypothetical protein